MHRVLLTIAAGVGAVALMSGTASASDGNTAKEAAAPSEKVHVVQSGDSLSSIAQSEQLESWRPLWNANPELEDPDLIYADQKLVVPAGPMEDRPVPEKAVVPAQQSYAAPVQTAARTVSRPAATYAQGSGGIFANIRARESGGNYSTNTGNGYYGAYQFDVGTWQGVGGTGLPSDASPAEQDMRAQMLYDRRGCSPWPNTCY